MKLTVTFSLDNAAFEENGPASAAWVLREAAEEIEGRHALMTNDLIRLWDINGNRIGFLTVED